MTDNNPTDQELEVLRGQLESAKRQAEYEQLKQDLQEITYKTANTPNEFEGSMQIPDTDRVLKPKRTEKRFVELIAERIRGMFSVRPVIGNIIALLLAGIALYYIFNEIKEPWFIKYQNYFGIGIQLFAALQIIKSGSRSLLLPVLALVVGGIASHSLSADQTLFHFGRAFFEHLTIVGVIGIGISILSID